MNKNGRTEVVTVVALAQSTGNALGVGALNIAPGNGASFISDSSPKLAALSDLFSYYRVKKLVVRVHPGMPNSHAAFDYQAIGVAPGALQNAPTSLGEVLDLPWSRLISPNVSSDNVCSVVREFVVPPEHYKGQVKWYKTVLNGSVDNQLEICGQLYTYAEASATHRLETEVTYEFREFIGPSSNPMRRQNSLVDQQWVDTQSPIPAPLPAPARPLDKPARPR
jgi:hypothetical protein